MTDAIFVLCGNDGTGKSTLCNLINEKKSNVLALERNSKECITLGIDPSIIDNLTLEYGKLF